MKIKLGLGGLPNPLTEIAKAAKSVADGVTNAAKTGMAGLADETTHAADLAQAASHLFIGTPRHYGRQPIDDPNRLDGADVYAFKQRTIPAAIAVAKAAQTFGVMGGMVTASLAVPAFLHAGDAGRALVDGAAAASRGQDGAAVAGKGLADAEARRAALAATLLIPTAFSAGNFVQAQQEAKVAVLEALFPDTDGRLGLRDIEGRTAAPFLALEKGISDASRMANGAWKVVDRSFDEAGASAKALFEGAQDFSKNVSTHALGQTTEAWRGIRDGLASARKPVQELVGWTLGTATQGVEGGVDRLNDTWNAVKNALTPTLEFGEKLGRWALDKAERSGGAAIDAVSNHLDEFKSRIGDLLEVGGAITDFLRGKAGAAVGMPGERNDSADETVLALQEFLPRLLGLNGIGAKIAQVIERVRAPIDNAVGWVAGQAPDAVDGIGERMSS